MRATKETESELLGQKNHEKGLDLENRFCEYMKSELGYTQAHMGTTVTSRVNGSGIKLDILAVKETDLLRRANKVVFVLFIICILATVLSIWFVPIINYWYYSAFLFSLGAMFSVILFVRQRAYKNITEYAWVECKNWDKEVPIKEVEKMLFEFNSHASSRDRRYDFKHKYFVAANGFYKNALIYAADNGIICYICKDGKFELVDCKI